MVSGAMSSYADNSRASLKNYSHTICTTIGGNTWLGLFVTLYLQIKLIFLIPIPLKYFTNQHAIKRRNMYALKESTVLKCKW